MSARIIPASVEHVAVIAPRMREADKDEVFAAVGRGPASALLHSLRCSDLAYTVEYDGRPELMFGCGTTNMIANVGAPWALGTDAIDDHPTHFLRGSLFWVREVRKRYASLLNVVDDRNEASKRWLEWLGFTLSEPQPYGYEQRPFRIFEMKA
ncbi:hypothetical protein [Agrobacterium cavarae]|uniref:hypothetical protein n=1 Tax=Agrobacterium cavarae TaxID=2528239 RepID=UPI002FF8B91C